jgi:predicted DsbA family dithiol-disulfide isomerase
MNPFGPGTERRIARLARVSNIHWAPTGGKAVGGMGKPELPVVLFTDYICPFCYIGDRRLARLSERYDLKVERRFLEIHPDTPPGGVPVSELGYPQEQWRQMMANLSRMADEEMIALTERKITTNSHKALLLAEATKEEGTEVFEALNEKLFAAFFREGRNIGDDLVLRSLAQEAGLSQEIVERAFCEPAYEQMLRANQGIASQLGITGVPAYLIGNRIIVGAVPTETLLAAAREAIPSPP